MVVFKNLNYLSAMSFTDNIRNISLSKAIIFVLPKKCFVKDYS